MNLAVTFPHVTQKNGCNASNLWRIPVKNGGPTLGQSTWCRRSNVYAVCTWLAPHGNKNVWHAETRLPSSIKQKNTKYGLLPIIHISNYLYNPLTTCYTNQQHKASSVLETINKEALLINKELLPQVQPRFTPEYAYISLLNADTIRQELNTFNKSKQGLVNLLTNITVPGTNISSFIECLLDVSGLNQNVMDVESYLYLKIRHLIEINIC